MIPAVLAPYEFLRPNWGEFSLYFVFLVIISIGAIVLGGMFMLAGLLGLNQTLRFTVSSKTVHYSYESTLAPLRRKTYKFSDIVKVEVTTHDWTEGPTTYGLKFTFKDGQRTEPCSFGKKDEAEQFLAKVENLIR